MLESIVLTGASGFIGKHLLEGLAERGYPVRPVVRAASAAGLTFSQPPCLIDGLLPDQDWTEILAGQNVVIHCAGRVHMMDDAAADPMAAFRLVNAEGTLALARQAAAAGVRRFIFISTIKVNGEETRTDRPYTAQDTPMPQDPYGISKLEAEQGLMELGAQTGMEIVIIRPVLVYGPGVKANFRSMMKWVAKGVPLPLGAIHNKRSFIALENLNDLIITCINHPAAANQTFLACDGEDLSTTELLHRIAKAMGRKARLVPVPVNLLELGARLLGRDVIAQRLCGTLRADITHTRKTLGWTPPVSVDEGLLVTADAYLAGRK